MSIFHVWLNYLFQFNKAFEFQKLQMLHKSGLLDIQNVVFYEPQKKGEYVGFQWHKGKKIMRVISMFGWTPLLDKTEDMPWFYNNNSFRLSRHLSSSPNWATN